MPVTTSSSKQATRRFCQGVTSRFLLLVVKSRVDLSFSVFYRLLLDVAPLVEEARISSRLERLSTARRPTRDVGKYVAELVQSITTQKQPADRIIIALDYKEVVARAKLHEWSTRRHVVSRQRQEFEEISQRIQGTLESNRGKQARKRVAVIPVTLLMSVYGGSTKGHTARCQSSVSSCT